MTQVSSYPQGYTSRKNSKQCNVFKVQDASKAIGKQASIKVEISEDVDLKTSTGESVTPSEIRESLLETAPPEG